MGCDFHVNVIDKMTETSVRKVHYVLVNGNSEIKRFLACPTLQGSSFI